MHAQHHMEDINRNFNLKLQNVITIFYAKKDVYHVSEIICSGGGAEIQEKSKIDFDVL